MKKLLVLCFSVFICACGVSTEQTIDKPIINEASEDEKDTLINQYMDISETSEWENLSLEKRKNKAQLPDELLDLSTNQLTELVLSYPYLIDMLAYDREEDGFAYVLNSYNGLQELVSREDAAEELYSKYVQLDEDDISRTYIEYLLVYGVHDQLTKEQKEIFNGGEK